MKRDPFDDMQVGIHADVTIHHAFTYSLRVGPSSVRGVK